MHHYEHEKLYKIKILWHGGKDDLFETMQYKKQGFCEGEVLGGMSNNEVLKLLRITKALR